VLCHFCDSWLLAYGLIGIECVEFSAILRLLAFNIHTASLSLFLSVTPSAVHAVPIAAKQMILIKKTIATRQNALSVCIGEVSQSLALKLSKFISGAYFLAKLLNFGQALALHRHPETMRLNERKQTMS